MSTTSPYEILVLIEGHLECTDTGNVVHCSSTLIKGPKNIIVDTTVPYIEDELLESLKDHDITCDQIDYVICTQGTPLHSGCNYLFKNAKHIVGYCISHQDMYEDHDFRSGREYIIDDNVKVVPTPGFTLQDVSVIVQTNDKGVVVMTGDLFEHRDVLSKQGYWNASAVDSEELLLKNRRLILNRADWIIPGRSPMFKVENAHKDL